MSFMVVGITGRSGSGKSSLTKYIASLGYPTCDGDALSKEIAVAGSSCVKELVAAFGEEIVSPEGDLLRRKLANIAFKTRKNTKLLNKIVHPYIMEELLQREKAARKKGAKLFFLDGAAIIGTPFEKHCDKIIAVTAEYKLSISRIVLRDGISKIAADRRLAAQITEKELLLKADYVIENNNGIEQLHQQGEAVLKELLQHCKEEK